MWMKIKVLTAKGQPWFTQHRGSAHSEISQTVQRRYGRQPNGVRHKWEIVSEEKQDVFLGEPDPVTRFLDVLVTTIELFQEITRDQQSPMTLGKLRAGAIFATNNGILAVKSEYVYSNEPDAQCQCVLLASGEYAHFPDGNDTEVKEVSIRWIP